jgi:hypothetical protein
MGDTITRPPIPQSPLVDPRTGNVTREWWRWFASIGTASLSTAATITDITNNITEFVDSAPLPDDPVDTANVVRQALELRRPDECGCDLSEAARLALELYRPPDQALTDPLLQLELQVPGDPLPTDQLMLMAAMLAPLDGLPSYRQGSILAGGAGGWFATRVISKSPTGYPVAAKYSSFDTTGNTIEVVNDDQNPSRILLVAFDNSGGNNAFPTWNSRYARGTAALPTAVQSGDIISTGFAPAGYAATDFNTSAGRVRAIALENFDATHNGLKFELATCAPGATTPTAVSELKTTGCWFLGTNTNDNAAAGVVGEVVEADVQASPVNLTNNTAADITSISLTAGDWDVEGWVMFIPATGAATQYKAWISTTSATDPGANDAGAYLNVVPVASVANYGVPIGQKRISLNAGATAYLSVKALFPNTCTGQGHIKARRVR